MVEKKHMAVKQTSKLQVPFRASVLMTDQTLDGGDRHIDQRFVRIPSFGEGGFEPG